MDQGWEHSKRKFRKNLPKKGLKKEERSLRRAQWVKIRKAKRKV